MSGELGDKLFSVIRRVDEGRTLVLAKKHFRLLGLVVTGMLLCSGRNRAEARRHVTFSQRNRLYNYVVKCVIRAMDRGRGILISLMSLHRHRVPTNENSKNFPGRDMAAYDGAGVGQITLSSRSRPGGRSLVGETLMENTCSKLTPRRSRSRDIRYKFLKTGEDLGHACNGLCCGGAMVVGRRDVGITGMPLVTSNLVLRNGVAVGELVVANTCITRTKLVF